MCAFYAWKQEEVIMVKSRKLISRITVAILVFCMTFVAMLAIIPDGTISFSSSAASGTGVSSLTAITSSGTYYLTKNVVVTMSAVTSERSDSYSSYALSVASGNTVTLDLNGYNIYFAVGSSNSNANQRVFNRKGITNTFTWGAYNYYSSYWGVIQNAGTLTITNSSSSASTIAATAIAEDIEDSSSAKLTMGMLCTIYNTGTLDIGSNITVGAYVEYCGEDDDNVNNLASRAILYVYGIYNTGTLTSEADIEADGLVAPIAAGTSYASYSIIFAYGIYSTGSSALVTLTGGSVTVITYAGFSDAENTSSDESGIVLQVAIGIYNNSSVSNNGNSCVLDGTIDISVSTHSFESMDTCYDPWGEGSDQAYAFGIAYNTLMPKIGVGVTMDIEAIYMGTNDDTIPVSGYSWSVAGGYTPNNSSYNNSDGDTEAPDMRNHQTLQVAQTSLNNTTGGAYSDGYGYATSFTSYTTKNLFSAYDDSIYLTFSEGKYGGEQSIRTGTLVNLQYTCSYVDEDAQCDYRTSSLAVSSSTTVASYMNNGAPTTDLDDESAPTSQVMIVYRYYDYSTKSFDSAATGSGVYAFDSHGIGYSRYASTSGAAYSILSSIEFADKTNYNLFYTTGGASSDSEYLSFYTTTYYCMTSETYYAYLNGTYSWSAITGQTLIYNSECNTSASAHSSTNDVMVIFFDYYIMSTFNSYSLAGSLDELSALQALGTLNYTWQSQTAYADTVVYADYDGTTIEPYTDYDFAIFRISMVTSALVKAYGGTLQDDDSYQNTNAVWYYSSDSGSTYTQGYPTNAGTYIIKVIVPDDTSSSNKNSYNCYGHTRYFTLVINPIEIADIDFSNLVLSGTYGDTLDELTISGYISYTDSSGNAVKISSNISDYIAFDDADYVPECSETSITVYFSPTDGNYTTTDGTATISIAKKAITLTLEDTAIVEGGEAEFEFTCDDIVSGDEYLLAQWLDDSTFQVYVNGSWIDYEDGMEELEVDNTYTYTIKVFNGGVNPDNYTISWIDGTITVVEAIFVDFDVKISGDAYIGYTLTATIVNLEYEDDDPVETKAEQYLSYQWYQMLDGVYQIIPGATSSTYTVQENDDGCYLVCLAYYTSSSKYQIVSGSKNSVVVNGPAGIYGITDDQVEERTYTLWEKLLAWFYRIIAAIMGIFGLVG